MMTYNFQINHKAISAPFLTLLFVYLLTGCAQNGSLSSVASTSSTDSASSAPDDSSSQGTTATTPTPTPSPSPTYKAEALIWESSSYPERTKWSEAAIKFVTEKYDTLNAATDVAQFCPTYASLSKDQRINLIADIFAATAYYECAWDPTAASVDVGTSNNKDTWSVGLLQLSVVDQANYGFDFGFNYSDLQDPINNLQLGVAIMAKQISKRGVFMIPTGGSGLYWATLHPGGKYDQSANIIKMTKKLSFCK